MLDKLRLSALYLLIAGYCALVGACTVDLFTADHGLSLVSEAP